MNIKKQYIDHNFSSRGGSKIEWIVIHYAGIADAQGRADVVARSLSRASKTDCDEKLKRTASTHYIVGDSDIIQLVRDRHKAWHVGGYSTSNKCAACNKNSIGVDIVEHKIDPSTRSVDDRDWYFSKSALDRAVQLVAWIADVYGIDADHIVRHYDVTGKHCPRPFVGNDKNEYYGVEHDRLWEIFKQSVHAQRLVQSKNYSLSELF
jgi:N-acetyl-anhydromuramyl-L-alanine amidase AmpD